jgi:HAD superfamily hydrolase (TIGR01509 family)
VNQRKRTLKAVVFDLDGVLLDSESAWDAARRAVAAEAGGHWRDSATTDMMGMSSPAASRYLRDELGVPLAPDDVNDRVVSALLARYREELPLLPGAVAAVELLPARWPLGLASSANRPVIDAALELSGLRANFAVTVSGEEVARGKPAPDVYLEAAQKLGVDPFNAAAVEDSTNGIRSAAAAGMLVVAVPNRQFAPTPEAVSLADLVIESLDELTPRALVSA